MIYSCGPTVYDKVHIGNLRIYVLTDVLSAYLNDNNSIINITDIDDKILDQLPNSATFAEYDAFVKKYIDYFESAIHSLNINEPHKLVRVSNVIPEILQYMTEIKSENITYDLDNSLRFKTDQTNFVLWKTHASDKIVWPSEYGCGRPGWHIECAAIIRQYLLKNKTNSLDYHLAGMDLKAIHSAAETTLLDELQIKISQWVHIGSVDINNVKMSKSKGNCIYIEELDAGFEYVLRFFYLSRNYAKTVNYSKDAYAQKCKELLAIYKAILNHYIIKGTETNELVLNFSQFCILHNLRKDERTGLQILNSGTILNQVKKLKICDSHKIYFELNKWYKILPDKVFDKSYILTLKTLLTQYKKSKLEMQYAMSDMLRTRIKNEGYNINDATFELIPFQFSK